MRPTNSQLAPYRTTIFEAMSRARRASTARSTSARASRTRTGRTDVRRAAAEALLRRAQPVPADAGRAGAAPGGRRARPALSTGSTSIWQTEVLVTSGATEALAGVLLRRCSSRATRWCCSSRSTTPTCRSSARAGGVPRLVRLRPPDWALPREALRGGVLAAHPAAAAQHRRINPTGKVFDARSSPARRSAASARRLSPSATRSTSTSSSTARRTCR